MMGECESLTPLKYFTNERGPKTPPGGTPLLIICLLEYELFPSTNTAILFLIERDILASKTTVGDLYCQTSKTDSTRE